MIKIEQNMTVGRMELPEGVDHACFVDGEMREVIQYEINADRYRVRWDTIILGWQYTVSKWPPDGTVGGRVVEFAKQERESTRRLLIDLARTGIDIEAKKVQPAGHLLP